ncbi:MAG: hypothetical protein IJ639_10610, partial [Ruminococcus sp.]|nr:hypothetical protein [Ruminococcus sp.]
LGYILAILGLVGLGMVSAASSTLIVSLGIRTVAALHTASFVMIGAGAVSAAGGTIPLITKRIKARNNDRLIESRREADSKKLTEYAKDSLNPEKTRIRLEQLRRNNPNLSDLVDKCLNQMDRIDTYQARHKSLLDANEAIYLEDTIEVIDGSERRMCQNFRNIINCCILIEDTDSSADELDYQIINSSLADNEEELNTVATLLKYSVAYINNYNRNGVKDRSELDAWLKVMQASMEGHQ